MRTSNPAFKAFEQPQTWDDAHGVSKSRPTTMTIRGTIANTSILLGICAAAAIGAWTGIKSNPGLTIPLFAGGMIIGFILSLVIIFKPRTAPILAPIYAAAEGLFVGAFSLLVTDRVSQGAASVAGPLITQAIALTIAVTAAMLTLYATRIIRPGKVFRSVLLTAMGGLVLFFIAAVGLALFGNSTLISVYSVQNNSPISIGFSLLVIAIASLNLVLDFEFIEQGSREGAPKHMEWVGAFALMVTLVWLYIEILRLLAKLRSGD